MNAQSEHRPDTSAQDLLDFLVNCRNAGIDLSTLEVISKFTVYDGDGRGQDGETYSDRFEISEDALILS